MAHENTLVLILTLAVKDQSLLTFKFLFNFKATIQEAITVVHAYT